MRRYKPRKVVSFDWSPNLAYAVGLVTTDGCLSIDQRHVTFTSKDIEQIGNMKLILKIKSSICLTKNKISGSEAFRLQISNTQLYDWLLSIGLTPNKSLTLGPLKIPDKYFIRIFTTFISASKPHIDWLHKNIVRLMGIHGAVHVSKIRHEKQNPMHIIKFAKKDSLKLLAKIYYSENIPCLSRKRQVYTNFLKQLSLEQ